ncbi:MAG: TetR/AcrR family transcriptional regulator [Lachnospiraceae bacterium]|nr:TetR/AcrR family transcriptional regulator [Lachnospiraceae bacterium]
MAKKNGHNTKGKIINAAWKLFYEQGYEDTTVEEIISESQTSKGSFYHYFDGKDALLGSLSYLFDEKYMELAETINLEDDSFDILMFLNKELFTMIENSISMELVARLYSSQIITRGERSLLDHDRFYYKLLKQIISSGRSRGQLSEDMTLNEQVKLYAMCERAIIYDWCMSNGEYSLSEYSCKNMPVLLSKFKK